MAIPFGSDINLNNNKILNANTNTPTANENLANKKYVDDKSCKISLTGQLQISSYRRSVVALCKVSTTDETNLNSYSSGDIYFHRMNGLEGMNWIRFSIENQYNNAFYFNFNYLSNLTLNTSTEAATGVGFRPCTFKYNDEYYGGIEVFIANAELSVIEFIGSTNFGIFGLDYYRLDYNDNMNPIIMNQEVYDSLNYTQHIINKQQLYGIKADAAPTGDTLPIGSVMEWYSDNIPSNWLLCNGQAVSRTEYAELFAVLGTKYGEGDGSTTFNLPNRKTRVSVGKDSSDSDFDTLGKTDGEKNVKLEPNNYSYQVYSTNQNYSGNDLSTLWNPPAGSWGLGSNYITNNNVPHNNLQPYIVTNFIVKAKQSAGLVADVVDNLNSTSTTDALSAKQGKVLKEMIENIPTGTTSIVDVDSLPEITDDNRNQIIRYNGKLYSVSNKYTGTAQDLSVGADLSSAKLVLSFPDNLYSSGYSGVGNLTFITTEGSAISSYNGSSNNYMCCISIGTHGLYGSQIYSANTNTNEVYTNMKSYIMPSNAGKITELKDLSAVQNTGFYVNLTPYIKYIPATEAWICIDNEIAVGESEPTGQEKLWIDGEADSEEVQIDINTMYPIGATYVSKRNVNPSEYFGGTWVLDRDFRGGELIAYGSAYSTKTGVTVNGSTYKGWSDIFSTNNQNASVTNYVLGVLEHTSGTFKVNSKGLVGLVEATLTISGNGNSSCYAVWFGSNKNTIPDGAVQIGDARALKTVGQNGNYGGTSNQYLYEVTAGPNADISFYINPSFAAYPSAAEFYPGSGGVVCSLSVKVYSFKETRYLWRRTS